MLTVIIRNDKRKSISNSVQIVLNIFFEIAKSIIDTWLKILKHFPTFFPRENVLAIRCYPIKIIDGLMCISPCRLFTLRCYPFQTIGFVYNGLNI